MNITEGQASCMFFSKEYTEENVNLLTEKVESYGELARCYETNPENPVLVTKSRMFSSPFTFKRYLIPSPMESHETNVEGTRPLQSLIITSDNAAGLGTRPIQGPTIENSVLGTLPPCGLRPVVAGRLGPLARKPKPFGLVNSLAW
ncbi:hypothetical protein DM01DRAFT_327536 [Hesseltinella vesiculosa]|uniref:Uncharacterized protein n=1 Tax=Hesseltinella vesiculosa TaxID=101127 RepID=A0A1X2G737_9FUNG|nr:hypothetical protein DM01DRAFT_327536 [Hesseltinella vesiculosa]